MSLDVQVVAVALLAVGVIGFMKGAFGGGFAIIGIPLLALVMDPIAAGSLLAPLFVAMDVFALRYWRPRTGRGRTCSGCCQGCWRVCSRDISCCGT